MTTMPDRPEAEVTGGVDTHKDTHVAAVIDAVGRILGTRSFPVSAAGYRQLLAWMRGFGILNRVGVEGTGAYGAGLARHLTAAGVEVIEVLRPNRQTRRRHGKSDPADAEAAARAVLAGEATGRPKTGNGTVEAIRALRVARRSAVKARTQATNQLKNLIVTAPDQLRRDLEALPISRLIERAARFRPDVNRDPAEATKTAMRALARRYQALTAEITDHDQLVAELIAQTAPAGLLDAQGVGTDVAGALLVAAGDNPDRLDNDASFAALCGVSPVDASSGRNIRHRLNRGGDRTANAALWRIVMVRMSVDPRTKAYVARRRAEGKTTKEIMRCLKRYIAREIYKTLRTQTTRSAPDTDTLAA